MTISPQLLAIVEALAESQARADYAARFAAPVSAELFQPHGDLGDASHAVGRQGEFAHAS